MIRDRREEDLPHLCAVLESLGQPAPEAWLVSLDDAAEVSWVYDMAPMSVAPTSNVVGHVQVHDAPRDPATAYVVEHLGEPPERFLMIGRLFVAPLKHQHGIARHLLKTAAAHVVDRGRTPVLDLAANPSLTREMCLRRGFVDVPCEDGGVRPMVLTVTG